MKTSISGHVRGALLQTRGAVRRSRLTTLVVGCLGAVAQTAWPQDPAGAAPTLEEVVVTANKRQESAQNVSISVNAFTADDVHRLGAAQPKDFANFVPNLNAKNATGNENPIFTIRGVGISAFVGNANPSVGVYIDEMYLPTNMLMSFSLIDIDRVEVLKGPQGTLFGRNTTGGAVTFTSAQATREADGYVRMSYGNYDHFITEAALGGALTDTLAGRIAVKKDRQANGWARNTLNGDTVGKVDTSSFRVSLLWEPSDVTKVHWSLHGGVDRGETHPWEHIGVFDSTRPTVDSRYPGGVYYGGSGGFGFPLRCPGGDGDASSATLQGTPTCVDRSGYREADRDPFKGSYNGSFRVDNEGYGSVLKISHDFSQASLISVTGWETYRRNSNEEFDSGPATLAEPNYRSNIDVYQQEFRLVSTGNGAVNWIGGVFFSHDTNDTNDLYRYANRFLADLAVDYQQKTDAAAVFGQLDWAFADSLKLIFGARYSSEKTRFDGGTSVVNPIAATTDFFGFNLQGTLTDADKSTSDSDYTGRVGLEWRPVSDLMVYGTVSRGYKSGGFSGFWTFTEEETEPYGSETLTAYELGLKSTLADGRMRLNAAAFTYDYSGLQLFALNTNFAFVLINADEAQVSGLELEWQYRPVAGLDLGLGLGYMAKAEITRFNTTGFLDDFNGRELPDTSEWTGTGSISYEWSLSDTLSMSAGSNVSYRSAKFTQIDNLPVNREPTSTLVDARLSLFPNDHRWSVSAWARNLTDQRYYQEKIFIANAGVANRLPGAPREYGVEVSYSVR